MKLNNSNSKREKNSAKKHLKDEKKSKNSEKQQFEFKCGCKKVYKSYYALYNHAKTMHGGILPAGSTDLSKVINSKNNAEKEMKVIDLFKKYKIFNTKFLRFLEGIPGSEGIFQTNEKGIVQDFPVDENKENEEKSILFSTLKKLTDEFRRKFGKNYIESIEFIIFEIENKKNFNCFEVLGLFLIYIFKFISSDFYQEICLLIILYLQMLNKKGWKRCLEFVKHFQIPKDETFCLSQSAELIPDFANIFILSYFPNFIKNKQSNKKSRMFIFFGVDPINYLRTVLLVQHISKWVYLSDFSHAEIEILKD